MAIKREEIIKNIIGMFTRFSDKVLFENAVGFLDINKSAEPLFMGVLNRVYDLQLKNMNSIQRNYPAIDLGDEGSGICYQITSSGTNDKYNHTLEKYKEKKLDDKFRELRFLLIGENNITKKDPDVRTKVFTLKSLIQDIDEMPDRDLEEFEQYFSAQMNEGDASGNILRAALLAPNGTDSFESFLTYLRVDDEYKKFAIDEINLFLAMLRKITPQQRQLLYFIVHDGHFPNAHRRNKGDTNNVYIACDLVYEEFNPRIQSVIGALEQRGFIEYDDDYYYQGQEYPTKAFRACWFGKESEINFSAAVKDFLGNNADDLYEFFVNTDTSKLA
ncbi:SMEK domain-containing protein [Pseudomonas amygdali]|uniref:SMEK domain-containing protein n=1 Tax=Pseudomonas amygdali TaxID=47877 RepID=UPI000EFEA9D6|nr:SMEK domain-containing protein [Pseudomonas amygdali]